ncbi:MAG TPA: hypothetical protein VFJ82_21065 [Longimicrobium sp.]|nr:hypothetical protein [Longimicrobium sp.]
MNWAGSMDAMHQELNVRRVLFVGIDQALLPTVAAALRLHADYYLSVSSAGDAPDTEWGEHQGVVALGARAGADFVHLFFETDLNPEYRPPRR